MDSQYLPKAPGSVLSLSSHSTGSLRLALRDADEGPGREPSIVAMAITVGVRDPPFRVFQSADSFFPVLFLWNVLP